jgi:hypothetical protein
MGKFNPELLPNAFACCPICHAKGALEIKKKGSDMFLSCRACGAMWVELTESGMRLVSGSDEHIGHKNLAEWASLSGTPLDLTVMDIVVEVVPQTKIDPQPNQKQNLTPRGILAVLLILVLVAVPAYFVWNSCTNSINDIITTTSKPAVVQYQITGTAKSVDVTLNNVSGGTEQYSGVSVPHTFTYNNFTDYFLYISAQNNGQTGTVIVTIIVNGQVLKTSSSSGAYVIASADAARP